jgi:hypothetical protein
LGGKFLIPLVCDCVCDYTPTIKVEVVGKVGHLYQKMRELGTHPLQYFT